MIEGAICFNGISSSITTGDRYEISIIHLTSIQNPALTDQKKEM